MDVRTSRSEEGKSSYGGSEDGGTRVGGGGGLRWVGWFDGATVLRLRVSEEMVTAFPPCSALSSGIPALQLMRHISTLPTRSCSFQLCERGHGGLVGW